MYYYVNLRLLLMDDGYECFACSDTSDDDNFSY